MPNRREVLRAGIVLGGGGLLAACAGSTGPGLVRSDRPVLTHGVQAGEVTADSALVWARADRPSRMVVEVASDPSFANARRLDGPELTPDTDLTGRLRVPAAPGRTTFYRVSADGSDPVVGTFRRPPSGTEDVRFVWTGDVVGQGWGIDESRGGMALYRAMQARDPDFLLHSGDTVYADGPVEETATLPDGSTWRNLVTPEKTKVAETLAEFRGQWAYNLLDEHYRAFQAAVPTYASWDDHEVTNNWYPGEVLTDAKYAGENRVDVLAARAAQAFREWMPIEGGRIHRRVPYGPQLDVFVLDMRTNRGPNPEALTAPAAPMLGEEQVAWLLDGLAASRATWKVIAADMPLGIVVKDGDTGIEAVANNAAGAPGGREAELARVLTGIRERGVRNTVWLTADVHYTAANRYTPERAGIAADPFWEFVSGPAHAGAFPASPLDPTFGPEQVFVHAPTTSNVSPAEGFQHFGEVSISGGRLRVDLRDATGASLWSTELQPA
ncbi:alkaline phosphatase D family protein [Actinomycetospora termitidis]|uniref:Alkaline phosphatase D family protein n=1 Tax=Actinomycetospora termitidis TaxID=3053470 RepID=A0ABT7M994_9PSEU|nr:alkaline phosphatase D family protein [Actinomycetospora sp. Odt1-22]MDL5156362.1 alkaline phosphatase D family protein [Actinomycetospora sp. Odt1-22]